MHEPFAMEKLLDGAWRGLRFEPFRDGIEIHHIIKGEPAVAILRYAPGATVPLHRHRGLETVVVLEGSQSDERGHYKKGAVVLNTEGSLHSVRSDEGCIVLIQWAREIEFV